MHTTIFSGDTLGCVEEKCFLESDTDISTKHSDESENWNKMKRRSSSNAEQYKRPSNVLRTNLSPSFVNKTKRILKFPFHECNISSSNEVDKTEYSPKQFKGPLDNLMLKIVGERWVPQFEDTGEFNNENNMCDNYVVNDESRVHHTNNCELELKGLKESLSSYSISSLKQL